MKKQTGFTLIELIMVIVILGILSAFALPRFADLSGNAEEAKLEGALGAIKSANAIAHAACLADTDCSTSSDSSDVDLDGAPSLDMDYGYPGADAATTGIAQATDLNGYGVIVVTDADGAVANGNNSGTAADDAGIVITNNVAVADGDACIYFVEADSDSAPSIGSGTYAKDDDTNTTAEAADTCTRTP